MAGAPPEGTVDTATTAHAGVMAAIHREAFPPAQSWSREVMLLHLELPGTFGFVHTLGGMILGGVAADEAEILTLAVSPAHRSLGLGTALLRAAMRRAAALGAASMVLEVAVTNRAARALYAAHGFAEAGTRRNYYSDGTDALILRSTLPEGLT